MIFGMFRPSRFTLAIVGPLVALFALACGEAPPFPWFGPTATPTLTQTPTRTPTPTPSPTPIPAARIQRADEAMFAGDWERAIFEYQQVLSQSDDSALRPTAQLGLGKARLFGGDPPGAAREFSTFLETYPDSPQIADAHFLLGETFRATGTWVQSIEGYRKYLELRPGIIDSYVHERIGQAAYFSQAHHTAAQAYQAAIVAPRAGEVNDLRERLAEVYLAQNDAPNALAQYDAVLAETNQNWRKARALVLAGDALYHAGRVEEAHTKYLEAVNNYPEADDSFQGLLKLVNDGVEVNELQRGLTNYYAENFEPALAAFDRYLAVNNGDVNALYHKGLTLNKLQRNADAMAVFRQIVASSPTHPLWAEAYLQIAFIQEYPQDRQTFQDFVAAAPTAPEAPDALFRAARLAERNDDFAAAAQLWARIASEYPQSEQAAEAALQAGIVLYRAGEFTSAALRFEQVMTLGSDPSQHARAWLWIGKVKEKQGDAPGAREAWLKAVPLDPDGYYSLRAAQLLRDEKPFVPPLHYNFSFDAAKEKAEAEVWLRATFPQATAPITHLSELQPGIAQEQRFARGAELWRLGLLRAAHEEFDNLRRDLTADSAAMWQLAVYFNEIGAYDLSIRSARQVLDLAGMTNPALGPRYLQRLRFPAPFANLVVPASQQYQQHPFLMYAKMRLESFFWKYAFSSAQARGLNQIIPTTANDIAQKLNLTDFEQDDLFRPVVSIPMGAFYLNFVGQTTQSDPAAILAGYYAGPGNANAWLQMSGGDPDLFVEVIRLPDAQGYVQTAYEYFEMYRALYLAP